jgi:GMP synthase (glutamine-hydrolysing)
MSQSTDPARHHERLLIVDFGSQVTQLIARRLRELNVYCEIHPFQNVTEDFLAEFAPKAVIFSGGPASVIDDGSPRPADGRVRAGRADPRHLLRPAGDDADAGRRSRAWRGHGGVRARLRGSTDDRIDLLTGWFLDGREQVWMSHGDHVSRIAPGFEVYATSPGAPYAITADLSRNFYAVQFHPEVHHTPNGRTLYENFVKLAGFKGDWTMAAYRDEAIRQIREQVGDAKVICGLSGGVDSSVAAVLIHEAIGDQLTCVFVDHGLLRQNEADEVVSMFRDHYNIPLIHADESERFLGEAGRCFRPRDKAQDHRQAVHRRVPALRGWDRRRGVPRPGHALSRCHRSVSAFPAAPPSPSSRTTMSAACPRRWA